MYRHGASIIAITYDNGKIFTIDKKLNLKVFDVNKFELIFDKSLLIMKGFPVSMEYFDPFNLGYMYLLKVNGNVVAFTCDLGTLVFKINL